MLERRWGKGNTSPLLVGVQTGTATLDISRLISQKIRKQPTSRPSNTTFGYISKGRSIIPQGHVLNYVHSIFNTQNLETTDMSLDQNVDKEDVVHLHNEVLHSRKKNTDILTFVGKWMNLENIILSEVTQTQKDKYNVYSFIRGF